MKFQANNLANVDKLWITLPETNSSPLKIGLPIGKACIPTIIFQGQAVSFREGNPMNDECWTKIMGKPPNHQF